MKKTDSIISDLTDFFDYHLLSSGKKELALKTANQLIRGEEKFQGVDLKLLLEEGKMLQAYQTEIRPRQWYIKFSQPDKYRELRKKHLSLNKSQSLTVKTISCPNCGNTEILEGSHCDKCGNYIPVVDKTTGGNSLRNDLEAIGNGFEKLKENRNLKMVGWVIVILMVVVFFYKVSTDKNYRERSGRSKSESEPYAYIKTKEFVELELKYPEEANFDWFPQFAEWEENNNYRIISYVTTKNAFGVKSKLKFFCVLHYKGGNNNDAENWELVKLEIDDPNGY